MQTKQTFSPFIPGIIMHHQVAKIIRFHRKRSRCTQMELADMAGVGKNMIYELENGKLSVRLDNLLKILQVLNIRLDFQSPLHNAFLKEYPDAES